MNRETDRQTDRQTERQGEIVQTPTESADPTRSCSVIKKNMLKKIFLNLFRSLDFLVNP